MHYNHNPTLHSRFSVSLVSVTIKMHTLGLDTGALPCSCVSIVNWLSVPVARVAKPYGDAWLFIVVIVTHGQHCAGNCRGIVGSGVSDFYCVDTVYCYKTVSVLLCLHDLPSQLQNTCGDLTDQ